MSCVGKKVRLETRGFRACFWEVDHPLCYVIGVQVFGKGKIYKPTWTQNHPWAYGPRMVLCPALELETDHDLNFKSGIKATEELYRSDFSFINQYFLWLGIFNYQFHNKK